MSENRAASRAQLKRIAAQLTGRTRGDEFTAEEMAEHRRTLAQDAGAARSLTFHSLVRELVNASIHQTEDYEAARESVLAMFENMNDRLVKAESR